MPCYGIVNGGVTIEERATCVMDRGAASNCSQGSEPQTPAFLLRYCSMNWYEGNPGLLGLRGRPPVFSANAPALFGADNDIGTFCEHLMQQAYGYAAPNVTF